MSLSFRCESLEDFMFYCILMGPAVWPITALNEWQNDDVNTYVSD